ncbi:MAG: hypothetical protein ACMV16_04620 [Macromonas sp.]
MREPSDTYQLYDQDRFSRRVSAELEVQLGKGTIVAREVNGFEGLWIGFEIERDSYWLLADPERVGTLDSTTWLAWLGIALAVSLGSRMPMRRFSFSTSVCTSQIRSIASECTSAARLRFTSDAN